MAKIKVKKSLSAMDIAALVKEYQALLGCYIKKAYQPEREVIVLRLNVGGVKRELIIRTGRTFFLTDKGPDNPPLPTAFAMLLRKYLTNGRIISVEQVEFDRIMIIGVQKEERYDLIVEGFGDGNVILVKNGMIIQPLISRSWRHRVVRAGREYEVPPAPANPITMERDEFDTALMSSERDIVRTLAMDVNLGGIYGEEVCAVCGIEKDRSSAGLTHEERDGLWNAMRELWNRLERGGSGIVLEGGEVEAGDEAGNGSGDIPGNGTDEIADNNTAETDTDGADKNGGDGSGDSLVNDVSPDDGSDDDLKQRKFVNVTPFSLKVFDVPELLYKPIEPFNDAVEKYFRRVLLDKTQGTGTGTGGSSGSGMLGYGQGGTGTEDGEGGAFNSEEVKRILRTIEQQEQTIEMLGGAVKEDKERADRLFLKYAEYEAVLTQILQYGEKHGWSEMATALTKHPKILEVNTAKKFVIIADEPTNIRLDYMKNMNENAQRYYEASARSRDKMAGAKVALGESQENLLKARKHAKKIEERKVTERKRFWFEKYRWFISSEGNVIVGGKDAFTNDRVVKKYLKDRDRFVHADIHGAPSLVIKSHQNDEGAGDATLNEACIYAACFSRAWRSGIGGVESFWVLPDQVSKTPAAGEFIAKGAFIIRGRRNRISATLRLAIGTIVYEGIEMVMCAPEGSVRAYTGSYLLFEPGEIPKNDFARRLSRHFGIKNDEALSIIPGDVRVAGTVGMKWEQE